MKITQLTAENVKRLQAVQITPDGSIVQITGRNGQGKSSVLDSIAYALGGKEAICAKPVRNGEKKARIVCQLDDLIVTRTFTEEGGGTLTVSNAEGARYPSPQAVLDKLVGKLTLDPLAFSRMAPKHQLETLKSLVGLDFTAIDREREQIYLERTNVNRTLTAMTPQIDAMPHHDGAPAEEVSISALAEEFTRRQKLNAENAKLRSRVAAAQSNIADLSEKMETFAAEDKTIGEKLDADLKASDDDLEREIARVRDHHQRHQQRLRESANAAHASAMERWEQYQQARVEEEKHLADLNAKASNIVEFDTAEISEQMASAESCNQKVRENRRRDALEAQAETLAAKSLQLSDRIKAIDESKRSQLASAAFPIPDLSFDASGVTFKGVPFAQASGAEQLRASVAIGLAMNPKLRVLLIRDGSLLDSEGMKLLAAIAEERDAQIWIERVEDGGHVGVVIEDGQVAAVPAEVLS